MGLHRVLRRYRALGGRATADYLRRRITNRLVAVINQVGPARKECPCCGWSGTRFLDFAGHGYGATNYVCPRCGSHPRHRGLVLHLREALKQLAPKDAVLHFAPELPISALMSDRKDLRYVTTDLTMKNVRARSDVLRLPFRDGEFTMVIASHVLEHVRDDCAAIREIGRITKKAGRALVLVPSWPDWETKPTQEFGKPDPQWDDHWRVYGNGLLKLMESAGLQPQPVRFSKFIPDSQMRRFGIREETIFVGVRK